MAQYGIETIGSCIHNLEYLNGVALQPEPVLGPKQARAAGPYKLQPPLVIFCTRVPNKKHLGSDSRAQNHNLSCSLSISTILWRKREIGIQ